MANLSYLSTAWKILSKSHCSSDIGQEMDISDHTDPLMILQVLTISNPFQQRMPSSRCIRLRKRWHPLMGGLVPSDDVLQMCLPYGNLMGSLR